MIQLPRHSSVPLKIYFDTTVTLYKVFSDLNDKSFYEDWKVFDNKINVIGGSCSHTNIVQKVFEKGEVILSSGDNNIATPILFRLPSGHSIESLDVNGFKVECNYGLIKTN